MTRGSGDGTQVRSSDVPRWDGERRSDGGIRGRGSSPVLNVVNDYSGRVRYEVSHTMRTRSVAYRFEFSSSSDTWLDHARRYVEMMSERFGISDQHLVVEIASNDGYLLQYFTACDVPVLGIEPAANVALVAQQKGIPTLVRFFGRESAEELLAQEAL